LSKYFIKFPDSIPKELLSTTPSIIFPSLITKFSPIFVFDLYSIFGSISEINSFPVIFYFDVLKSIPTEYKS